MLQVPVLMKGRLVNWIDSKATFGSQRIHRYYRPLSLAVWGSRCTSITCLNNP